MNDPLDAAVLGAGPAGLSAAYVLALRKANAAVFEADDVVGGLARTVEYEGSRFDLGGHRFFTRLPQVERLWLDLLDADMLVRPRLSRIYYDNRYFTYPLQAKEIIGRLGLGEATLCAISYLWSAARPSRPSESFEEWVTNRFGKRLYNAFFRGYTEKVWGIPGSEIRSEWAAQRIKNFSFPKALMSSLRLKHESVTSLIEEFHYPRLGPGQLWEALADRVRDGGVPIHFDSRVVSVRHGGGRVESIVVRQGGREVEQPVGALLSSIPLGELALSLDPAVPDEVRAAAGRLRYRSLVVVALVTSEPQPFPDNWIYLQDPGTRAGRVQNYGAWSEAMVQPHTTCLGVEYFCFEGDPIWEMGPEEALELAKSELASIGLIDPSRVIGGTKVNVPKAYPLYDREYAAAVDVIRRHLAGLENLETFGRNGLHRYNNQDHSMWTGALAALNLLDGSGYDVWSVNTDPAYLEERGSPIEHPLLDPFPDRMTMFVAWVVFPLVLAAISLGFGLLTERLAGGTVAGALLLPLGFAGAIVVSTLLTAVSATAQLALPAVVALALVGLALEALVPTRPRRIEGLAWTAAVAIFLVYGAPVILSGSATFAGYIKLDDTANWFGLSDHILHHGTSLAGLPISSYQATLRFYFHHGYPLGSLTVFAIGSRLVGTDPAWVYQPFLAFQAALLALAIDPLLRPLVRSPWRRAVGAFVAAQPALLYGYALWGSVKEIVTVPLIVLLAVLAPRLYRAERGLRALLPLGIAAAAVVAVLNVAGGVWIACAVLPCFVLAVKRLPRRELLVRVGALLGLAIVFTLPALATAQGFIQKALRTLTGEHTPVNLTHPLTVWQVGGIWPTGDFRIRPDHEWLAILLVLLAAAAAAWGVAEAVRGRVIELPLYVGTSLVGAAIFASFGSPWADAKVLATASSAILVAAAAGISRAFDRGPRAITAVAAAGAVVVAGGVIWSNALAYHDVWLAPRDQLLELATIGKRFAGQGPALLNEPNPYGVAHFLRRLDPEAPGEIRWRALPLRDGGEVKPNRYVDIDGLDPNAVLVYRTIVLPRSPLSSRPPSPYRLVRAGRFYDVWQRSKTAPRVLGHLTLGNPRIPWGVAPCRVVEQVGRDAAAADGRLAFVPRRLPVIHQLEDVMRSQAFTVTTPGGRYQAWLFATFPGRMEMRIDGRQVGVQRDRIEHIGQPVQFGTVDLAPGPHHVELRYSRNALRPGSGADFGSIGRFVLAQTTEDVPVQTIPASRAHELCGRTLDWIEAVS